MARRLPALTLLLALLPTILSASTTRDPYEHFFQFSLGDLTEELETARDEGKKGIFVFFEMDECPFCHRMKQTILNQPEVQDYFNDHFLSLSIDIEGDIEIVDFKGKDTTQKEFARGNRVRATPLLVFFDLQGEPIFKYVGAPTSTTEFMWMGEYIVNGVYLKTDDSGQHIRFTRYKRMKKLNKL